MGATEGIHGEGDRHSHSLDAKVAEEVVTPVFAMQALWEGKMTMDDFEVSGAEQPTVPHNVFEQDEALPVIDVGSLIGSDKQAREANRALMFDAAKTWGFFKIRNHGIALEMVKKFERNVKKFFDLSMEKKMLVKVPDFAFGYIGGSPVEWRPRWWMESLHLRDQEEAIRDLVTFVWSEDPEFAQEFIADLTSYFSSMRVLARLMVECLSESLGLSPDTFTKLETPNAICNARVNHYPPCPDPAKVFGMPAHTDPQMLSILYQDEVGGLQVLKEDKWIGIRPDDSTFVCNLGDTFQAVSNGILHSPAHRVTLNTTRSRYSTIYFYGIDNTVPLAVPPQLVTPERPLKYRPFIVNEYRQHLMSRGLPLDASKFLEVQTE